MDIFCLKKTHMINCKDVECLWYHTFINCKSVVVKLNSCLLPSKKETKCDNRYIKHKLILLDFLRAKKKHHFVGVKTKRIMQMTREMGMTTRENERSLTYCHNVQAWNWHHHTVCHFLKFQRDTEFKEYLYEIYSIGVSCDFSPLGFDDFDY